MRAIHNSRHYKKLKKDALEKPIIVISELLKKHCSLFIFKLAEIYFKALGGKMK